MSQIASHWRGILLLVLVGAGGAVASVQQSAQWPWLIVAGQVIAALIAYLQTTPATKAKLAALRANVDGLTAALAKKAGPLAAGLFLLGGLGLSAAGCAAAVQAVQDIQVGLNAAICIINTDSADSGEPPAQVIEDIIAKCGASAAQIAQVFDAEAAKADKAGDTTAATRARTLAAAARTKAAAK